MVTFEGKSRILQVICKPLDASPVRLPPESYVQWLSTASASGEERLSARDVNLLPSRLNSSRRSKPAAPYLSIRVTLDHQQNYVFEKLKDYGSRRGSWRD